MLQQLVSPIILEVAKMNKIKIIIGIIAILSTLFGQCMCPYDDNYPVGAFGGAGSYYYYYSTEIELIDKWDTIDATWQFKDGGELMIESRDKISKAYFIAGEETLEIIRNGESTVYSVEALSEKSLRLFTETEEIILEK